MAVGTPVIVTGCSFASNANTLTSGAISVGTAIPVGTFLCVRVYGATQSTQFTVVDSKSNTWIGTRQYGTGTAPAGCVQFFYCFVGTALTASDTITVGRSNSTSLGFDTFTVPGVNQVFPIDNGQVVAGDGASAAGTNVLPNTSVAYNTGDCILLVSEYGSTAAPGTSGGNTLLVAASTTVSNVRSGAVFYQLISGAPGTSTPQHTITSSTWACAGIVLRSADLTAGGVLDPPDTYLPDAALIIDDFDEPGISGLGFLYQPSPTQVIDATGASLTQTVTDDSGLTDVVVVDQGKAFADSAGLTDVLAVDQGKGLADSAGLTDNQATDQGKVLIDSAGLTDAPAVTQSKVLVDDTGLTDNVSASIGRGATITDDSGLTDNVTVTQSKAFADSAGLTDGQAVDQSKALADSSGLTDTLAVSQSKVVTDDSGLTDNLVVEKGRLVSQVDDAGLTDLTTVDQGKALVDSAGLTDAVATDQSKTLTDLAGLTDVVALDQAKVIADLAGLTDVVTLAQSKALADLAGLTDSTAIAQGKVVLDSAGLTDGIVAVLTPGGAPVTPVPNAPILGPRVLSGVLGTRTSGAATLGPRAQGGAILGPRTLGAILDPKRLSAVLDRRT